MELKSAFNLLDNNVLSEEVFKTVSKSVLRSKLAIVEGEIDELNK